MSKLENISAPFRNALVVQNDYNDTDMYTVSHQDALSTGDELGKGEFNNAVGSTTDIQMRTCLLNKNTYNNNYQYDSSTA